MSPLGLEERPENELLVEDLMPRLRPGEQLRHIRLRRWRRVPPPPIQIKGDAFHPELSPTGHGQAQGVAVQARAERARDHQPAERPALGSAFRRTGRGRQGEGAGARELLRSIARWGGGGEGGEEEAPMRGRSERDRDRGRGHRRGGARR